ncbi:hypothetical protein N8579_00465 [bacterium]|jgi:hypothetical protein|nr:hypothetical protein [bacterium]
MLNNIRDKGNRMNVTVTSLFNHMTDADFLALHDAGELKNFCWALSVDLQSKNHEKDNTYTA